MQMAAAPALLAAQASDAGFRAGFAEADITPEPGMEMPGGYGKSYHKTVHDPCKVRAAVFDDGAKIAAVVGLDALAVGRDTVLSARKAISERCGIAPEAILVNASHSHSSGPLFMVLRGQYDHASEEVRKLAYEKSTVADPAYVERVRSQIVAAVCEAHRNRVDARCGVGSGEERKAAYNRRFRMRNGLTYSHPGKGNPDIIGPAGPIDPEVGVIGCWDGGGRLTGCVVNYACHATTSPGGISANWIYYLEQTIRGVLGKDAVVVFIQGCCGDVTQVDNLSRYANPSGEQWARFVGGRVGAEAVKVLLSMQSGRLAPVDYASRVLRIRRRRPSSARLARARQIVRLDPKEAGATEWTFAKETVLLDALLAKEASSEAEVQAVQVGPAIFLSNPAELFCEFGLEMKSKSRFPFTFPAELSNGCVGYVPTEEALSPSGGGYETRLTSYSNLVRSAGRQMTDTALELAWNFKPGKVPEPPPAPPFANGPASIGSTPWSYGNVPAELE
jgi:hypothetical protein